MQKPNMGSQKIFPAGKEAKGFITYDRKNNDERKNRFDIERCGG